MLAQHTCSVHIVKEICVYTYAVTASLEMEDKNVL